jgi:hypothetical protein
MEFGKKCALDVYLPAVIEQDLAGCDWCREIEERSGLVF